MKNERDENKEAARAAILRELTATLGEMAEEAATASEGRDDIDHGLYMRGTAMSIKEGLPRIAALLDAAPAGKYVIVNDVDKPCERLVAQMIDGRAYYLQRSVEKHLRTYDGMTPSRATPLEDFGFDIQEQGGRVLFRQAFESKATYSNGTPRQWQGAESFTHDIVRFADYGIDRIEEVG